MSRNQKIIALIAVFLVVLGVGYYIYSSDNSDEQSQDNFSQEQEITEPEYYVSDEDQPTEPDSSAERPEEDEPSKTPVAVVAEKPLIYTGYGHSEEKPLPTGAQTSTSCTTTPKIDCKVIATHSTSGDIHTFGPTETNPEGVVLWKWIGGKELSSGKWELIATAGDKSSDKEIIFVE